MKSVSRSVLRTLVATALFLTLIVPTSHSWATYHGDSSLHDRAAGYAASRQHGQQEQTIDAPEDERQALVALYNSTNGPNWIERSGWLSGASPCTWYGVVCTNAHVTELNLPNNRLDGSLPSAITGLTYLKTLNLGINRLRGGIPVELVNFTYLENLGLGGNYFVGSIPVQLGQMSSLRSLSLGGRSLFGEPGLSGTIPASLGNLSNLEGLDLAGNSLSGSIPPQLGNLSRLKLLTVTGNHLTGPIPAQLGNLTGLEELHLEINSLSGAIPNQLGNLTNLRVLNLSWNGLSGALPRELGRLVNLRNLFVERNALSGPIPLEFTNLTSVYFTYYDTSLCEPNVAFFRAWLASIAYSGTGVACTGSLSVSGRIVDSGGRGIAAVTVSMPGSPSTYSDVNGYFGFLNVTAGTYAVQPAKSGVTFSPAVRTVTVPPAVSAANFVGSANSYNISGRVTDSSGQGVSGVTLAISGRGTVTTNSRGDFGVLGLPPGTYNVAPSKTGYIFSPSARNVTVPPERTDVNFTGIGYSFSISGRITDGQGRALQGVNVAIGGGITVMTNSEGRYRREGLQPGTYDIIPSKGDYSFTPGFRRTTLPPDRVQMDFVGARPPQSFTVPFFSQRDPRWKDHPLRTTGACTLSTIGTGGCTLTSATMVFMYYGAQQTSTGGTMSPPNVSDCMGTRACPFNWDRGAACSDGHAAFVARTGFDWGQLDREINQNHRPVIVKLSKKTNSNDTHWVVVVSGYGSDPRNYRMHDPWFADGANMLLSTRTTDYDPTGMAVYARQQRNQSGEALMGGVINDASARISEPEIHWTSGGYSVVPLANTIPVSGTVLIRAMSEVTMTVQLIAESSQGNIDEMLIWTSAQLTGLWEPFQTTLTLPVADVVYVRYRDDLGDMSATYSDTIFPFPAPPDASDRYLFLPAIQRTG